MNLKCISTLITIYAPGMGTYQSNISYLITKGNVYPPATDNREGYYTINGQQFPTYLFELTTDPITPVPVVDTDRDRKLIAERAEEIRSQSVRDAMDQYYNPEKFYARQRRKQDTINAISQHFVQGIPYGD